MMSNVQRLAAEHATLHSTGLPQNFLFPSDVSVVATSASSIGSVSARPNCELDSLMESAADGKARLELLLAGPDSSPYANGLFRLRLDIPSTYPATPPVAYFRTRIWHPNVDESTGRVATSILRSAQEEGSWNVNLTLWHVLVTVCRLLALPDSSPRARSNQDAARVLTRDHEAYVKRAAMMCNVHAPIPREWTEIVKKAKTREVVDVRLWHGDPASSTQTPVEGVQPSSSSSIPPVAGNGTVSLREERMRLRQTRMRERQQQLARRKNRASGSPDSASPSVGPSRPGSELASASELVRPPSLPASVSSFRTVDARQPVRASTWETPPQQQQPQSGPQPAAQQSSSFFTPTHSSATHISVDQVPATPEFQTTAAIHARIRAAQQHRQQQQQQQQQQERQQQQQYHSSIPSGTSSTSNPAFQTPVLGSSYVQLFRPSHRAVAPETPDPFNRTPAPDNRFMLKDALLSTLSGSAQMTPQSPLPPNPTLIPRAPVSSISEARRRAAADGSRVTPPFSSDLSLAAISRSRQPGMYVAVPSGPSSLEGDQKRLRGKATVPSSAFLSPASVNSITHTAPVLPQPFHPASSTGSIFARPSSKDGAEWPFPGPKTGPEGDAQPPMSPPSLHPSPPPGDTTDWYDSWMTKWTTFVTQKATQSGPDGEAHVRERLKAAGGRWDVYNQGRTGARMGVMRS